MKPMSTITRGRKGGPPGNDSGAGLVSNGARSSHPGRAAAGLTNSSPRRVCPAAHTARADAGASIEGWEKFFSRTFCRKGARR
jgi:hypothetical protein